MRLPFKQRILLVAAVSVGLTVFLFDFQGGLLGPYGGPGDIYHEIILALVLTIAGFLYLLLLRNRR